MAFAVRVPEDCEPLRALVPDQASEAKHEVALFADQVSVEALPELTVLGAALNVTRGGSAETVTVAD